MFKPLIFLSEIIKIRDGKAQNASGVRAKLHTFHGQIGESVRFQPGKQSCAGEAMEVILGHMDATYSNLTLAPKASMEEMISSEAQEDAGDFLLISPARDAQNPVEIYPSESLTIHDQNYVIRSSVNQKGPTPADCHYTTSVFSNNRWYTVNDYSIIKEMSGQEPWPKFSTFYLYEKMGENEPLPIPIKDAQYLPPSVRQTVRSTAKATVPQEEDIDLENVLEEIKEIHRMGIENLNNNISNIHNLTPDNPVLKQGMVMLEKLQNDYKRSDPCLICNESWFCNIQINEKNGMCSRCEGLAKKNLYTFGEANDMIPGPIPQCFEDLTYVEECAIKLAQPCMNVYCRQGGKTGLVGHTITYEQNIQSIVDELPHLPKDLPFIVLQKEGQTPKQLSVRPHKLKECLEYLVANSDAYQHVKISEANLQHYVDSQGQIEGIPILHYDFDNYHQDEEELDEEPFNERDRLLEKDLGGDVAAPRSMVPLQTNSKSIRDLLDKAIKASGKDDLKVPAFAYPEMSKKPLSEFGPDYYAKCHPKMFPTGKGDYNRVIVFL